MEPTDPEETPEVTGLPKLRDRVDNFLAVLQGHQDLMRGVAAKVDQNKTHELGSATKIRLTGDLKKMSTEAVGKIIRDLGKPLHDEIQQTKALTEEVRQKLLYQIIEADAGFKSTTKELGVYKKGYTPKTAFTPANTKWKGKAVKSGKKFTTDFRTDREKSLFNALVAQGAGPGYKIGRGGLVHSISLTDIGELASLSEEYTTVVPLGGRNVPFFAFSKGKPDHVKDGGRYVTPQLYIAAANQRLGEAVRAAYPETGEFQKAAIGWDYKLNRGKKKAKTYKAKVIPGVSNTLAPYDDSETINGELVIRGVFTNNPAVTRAQLAAGWTVRVPTTFEGKLNPSIVEENGIVVSTYMPGDFGLDNPILPGANIPMSRKYSPANRVSGPDSRAATAEYLFQSQFDDPSSDRYFQAQAKGLKKNAENILFGNKKSDPANRNRNLPFSEEYIEEVVQETTSKFVTLFNEYRLAQFVTKHLVDSVRRQIKSGRLNAPKLEAYAEGTGGSFSDLDVSLKVEEDIIRKVGAADVTANAALTAVVPLIQKHFGGLPLDIIADQLSLIYPDKLGGGEPASVILAYAKLLFAGTTSLTGKFRTLPTGDLNQSNPVLQMSFKRSAGKYAQREKVQNRSSISTVPFPDSGDISGPYDQTPEARAENLYNNIGTETGNILDELLAFQKDPDGQMLHADFVEASEQTAVQPSLGDDLLTHSHSMRVVSELYSAMKIPAVEEAFSALAKTMGRRLNIQGLGDLRGEQLLDILSGTMHDNFEFREGVDLLVALRAGKIPEGQRVASLLIANGWLPPTTVPQNIGRDVEIPISTPSEAKPFFNAPAAESTDSPEVAVEKGKDASRAKAVQEGIDIEQRDMGIDPTDYALIEDASDRERYRRLYMEAASNMQADLMDITAEQNKTVTSIESALIELNELQEDLNVFGTGTQLDGTRPANTGESRPIKRMLEVKTSRITEIKDKSDALKQEAARIDELVASERIEGLEPYIQRLDTLVDKPHKTRRNPESFAKFYGVSDDIAKLYANTEGRDQRKAIASRRRDQLNEQRLRMLTELPQHAGRLRAEASVKDDHALRLTEQATALAEANPAQEIYSLMSRWAKAKQRLEDLKGEYAELKPAAQNLIKGEVSRLGKFYNQSSADQLWDQLTALAQTHPDSGGPRPKYAGLTSKAMELLAESDRKKFNQKEYDRNQKVLITKLRGVTSSVELSGIGEMNHKPTILWSGNPDIGSIPGVDTDESGNIIPTMQSPSLPMKRVRKRAKNGRFASLSAIDPALRDAAHASNTAEMATLGLKSGDSESMINALQVLKKSGPPHLRLVADVLLSGVGDFVRTVNLSVVEMDNGFAGLYDAKSNTITLNLNEHNGRGLGDVLVHELLHGATVNVLSNPTTPAQIAASRRITQLRQLAANLAGKRGAVSPAVMHGLQSDAEFISYALTAPEFQTILKGLALPGQRSVWSRVVDSVLQFFGLDPKKFRNQRSAVDELLDFARMGMTSRRTFTTDARWDMHNADRVDAAEDKFNYHASRIETENSGVYGSRARYQSRIEESPRSDGSIQFTIYFDDKVVGGRVADTAAEAAEVREALNEEIFGEATQEDIDNLTQGFTEGDQTGGDAGDTRNALPSPGTGDATIDPEAALESMMPEGMVIEFHDTQAGVMGTRRAEPSIVRVNRVHLQEMVRGLPPTHAEGVIRATLDEELAELSADSVMSENDYVSLAVNMSESDRTQLEHSYYGAMRLDYAETVARIQADRESGAWTDADLGREWFRQQTTRLAFGETREDTIDRLLDLGDTDPGMFTRVVDAIAHYIDILKGRLAEAFSSGTAAKISIVSRNLRALRNEGVLPSPEPAPSGELGDSTAFLNALDNSIINGQEDRTRFALPVYGNKSKMDNIWTKARSTFYDMGHPELQMVLDVLNGTNKAVEYDMKQFHKRFPAMQKRALEAGFSLEDIMLVFGTTAPMVVEADRKVIRKQLKAFKATLRGKGLAWGEFQKKKDEKERELYDAAASRMASTFRKTQKAKENIFRDNGLGDVVDFMVEFRGRINKHKVQIGFDESNDVYLTRTYRYFKTPAYADAVKSGAVFTDPETGESIDFGALRTLASKEMFEKQVIKEAAKDNKRMSKDEIAQQTMVKLDEYLLTLDRRAKQNSTLDGVAMLRKDLNLLKTKKDIEAPLRALLGEVKDPFEVAVRTLHSVARFAANETFLRDFSETALKLGFASKEPAEGMELLFPSKLEDRFDALAGLYVKKDIANAIRDEFVPRGPALETSGQRAVNKVTRAASWLSGVSVFAKTSLGVGYWSRNMVSNGLLTTAQGLNPFNFSAMAEAINISRLANFDAGDNSTQEQRDHIRRLTELQIVRDDAQGRMTLDLMRGFAAGTQEQADAMLKLITEAQATGDMGKLKAAWAGSKIPTAASWLVESLANVNNWVDSMAKVNAYYQELNNIRDHYGDRKSETESEAYAAYKVKLTFPTHSQQLAVVKSFNRSPLGLAVLPFLRWKSEVLRTMFNTIPLAVAEIQAGETTRGVRRLVGFSATVAGGGKLVLSTAYMAANAVISSLADDEDGEDEETRDLTAEERADIRLGEPKWKREHDFVARLVGNQIQTVDLTYLLPHSMVTDIFAIASEGWQTDRPGTLNSLARYISGEVIGTNIAFTGLTETFGNEDDYGNPIALETDDVVTSTKKLMWHFYQATLEPSSFRKARAVTREGETKKFELIMGEVLGGRAVFLDRNEVAKKMFRSLKKTQDEAVQLRWSLTSGRAMPLEDVAPTIDKFNIAVAKNQYRLHQAITTLEGLGMSPREIQAVATSKSVRYSKQKIRDASLGIGRSWNPNKGWFNTAYSNMSDSEEVSDPMARINEVRRVISEGPGSYVVSVEGME